MADLSQAPVTTTIEEQPKISVQEFSKKVKEKYPDYADVDDVVLAQKMVEKYPEYKERVQFDKTLPETTIQKQQEQVRPQQPLTFMQKQLRERFPENYKDEVKPEAAALIQPPKELSTIDKLKVDYINRTRGEEFAAKKQKELESTEPSFISKLGKVTGNEFMLGTNQLNSWIADAPGFIYDLAGAPFRAAGLNVPTSKDFKNTPLTDVSTYYKDQSKLYEDKVKEINPERDKGITDSFKNGDIETGFLNLAGSISESMPASLAMILSGGETLPMILGGGAIFGAGKAQEIDENAPEMNYDKGRLVAAINGTLEGVFETYLGSGAVAKSLSNIIKKEGTEVAKDQVKKSLRTVFTDMLTKSPWLAPLGEGFEEVGTQLAQNAVDKYSGYKPDLDLMSGVGDSFLAGAGMGGIHGATIGLAKAAMKESGINPEEIQQPKPTITTATVEGQQYTVNNPEELGKGGSAIFITAEDGTVKAVNNLKLNDVVTQTPEEIELASQQAVEQQALMQGIDPNAQVIGDETNNFGNGQVRIVEFNNGQSKIFTPDGQEHVVNNEEETSAFLDKLFSGEQVVDQTQPEAAGVQKPSRKVISQKFGGTTIDIAEDEGFDEVIPNDKVTLDKALPALEKKFKGNENFELQVEKEEIEEPGETKYDKPIKKVVVKSIRIVPKKANISENQIENISETQNQPIEQQQIENIETENNQQIIQQNEKPVENVIQTAGQINQLQGENTPQAQQGQGNEKGLEENVSDRSSYGNMAADYLLTAGTGSILSSDYFIQGLSGVFTHAGSKIDAIRKKYFNEFTTSEFGDVKNFTGTELYNKIISEIRDAVNSSYGNNTEIQDIFNQIINHPTGLPYKLGQQINIRMDELNSVEQNIQAVPPVVVESFTPEDSAPLVNETTKTETPLNTEQNATKEGKIQKNNRREHPNGNRERQTERPSDSNRVESGREIQKEITEPQKVSFTYLDGSDHTGEVIGETKDGKLRIKAEDGLVYRIPKDKVNDVRFRVEEREKSEAEQTIDYLQSLDDSPKQVIQGTKKEIVQYLEDNGYPESTINLVRNTNFGAVIIGGKIFFDLGNVNTPEKAAINWLHERTHAETSGELTPEELIDLYKSLGPREVRRIIPSFYWNMSYEAQADEYISYAAEQLISTGQLDDLIPEHAKEIITNIVNQFTSPKILQDAKRQSNNLDNIRQGNAPGNVHGSNNNTRGAGETERSSEGEQNASARPGVSENEGRNEGKTGLTISDQAKEDLKTRHNALDAITRIGSELNIPIQVINSSEVQSGNDQLVFTDNGTVNIVSDRVKSVSDVIKSLVKEVAASKGLREMFAQADPNSIIGKQLAKFDELTDNELNSDKMAQIIRKAFRLTSNQFTNDDLREIVSRSRKQEARFRAEDQSQIVQDARKYNSFEDFVDAYKDAGFRDSHSAPRFDDTPTEEKLDSGGDFSLIEVANGFHNQPNDYFTPRIGARYYGYDDLEGMQSYTAINNIIRAIKAGNNDKTITAYRAVPKEIKLNKLIDGDWVTFSKKYAIGHGESRFGEKEYKIIKQEVNPKDLWWDGNDINEWGYDTGETQSLGRSDLKKIWDEVHGEIRFRILGETGAANLDKAEEATTRIDNLNVAREMEQAGKDVKYIRLATGWEKGIDGKWRYEVSEGKMVSGRVGHWFLPEIYEDPELYAAYPQIRDLDVVIARNNGRSVRGSFNGNVIHIYADDLKQANSTLNHEIQHAIQEIEGFAKGGNLQSGVAELYDRINKQLNDLAREMNNLTVPGNYGKFSDPKGYELKEKYDALMQEKLNANPYDYYKRLAGEVESRNVQTRMNMTPEERRNALLSETEDVSREDQIVLMEGLGVSNLGKGQLPFTNYLKSTDVKTGQPVTLTYLKNTEKAPYLGSRFGQDVEPSGFYFIQKEHDFPPSSGWVEGKITLKNPLVIPLTDENMIDYKRELSERYKGKKKKALSNAIKADGYDGIITTKDGYLGEMIKFDFDPSEVISNKIEQQRFEINTEPTEAQKEAGNYKKGHIRFDGFDISIENPKGSVRSGVDKQGNEWSQVLPSDYGYFRGTTGRDKDHVDVFIGDNPESDKIYVVDQINPSTGKFDEHKVMLGFNNITKAKQTYLAAFEEGWQGLGQITRTDKESLKDWFENGNQKKPFADSQVRFRIAEENPFDKLFSDLNELASTSKSKERLEELDAAKKEAKRAAKEQILKQIQGYKEGYRAGTNEMKLRLKLIQGNIIAYANKNMPYSEAGKRSITSLLTAIKNASTPATIEDAFNKIDELTEKINKKTVIAQIEKILKKNRPKKVDGKSAGKLDPDIYKVLKKIREVVDLKSDEEFEKFASNLNEEDVESVALFGMFSNLESKTEDKAKEALAQLSGIVTEGKVWYKEEMKKRKEYLDGIRSKVLDKITGGKPHMTQQDYIAAGTVPKDNFLNSYVLANQSLEWLLDIASKDKSEQAGEGWMQVHFGDLLNESTNKETKGIREAVELVNKAGERIFGVKENALARIFTANSKVVDNTGVTFATNEGRTEIPLSQNQAAKRWMEMQDPTLKGTFDKMGWDEQSLTELESFMTPQVKQWAEWQLNEFYPEYFKATNEAFRNNYFVDMPFNPKYSPIRREVIQQNNNDGELLQGSTMLNSVMSGSFISRIANINNILLQDANTVLFNHISEMEHFKAWIDSVKEMRSTLGSRDVQHAIKFEHGNKLRQEINNQINDFASGGSDKANVITLVDKIRGNFAVGELALNLSLYPKQAISILTFLADVPLNKYAEGLVDMALNIKSVIDMMKSSEFIKERYLSGWNYEVRSALKKETPEILSNAKSKFNEYKNKLMFPAQFGDYTSAIGGWTVYKYNYEKQLALELLKPGITQEQAEKNARKEAMTRYERSSARLLQSSALKDAASIQKGSFGKMFTMFKSQPQLQQRYESAGWRNLLRNRGSKAHNIKLIALFHVLLPVAFQAMANMFTDDDDDEKLKRLLIAGVIGSLNGFLIASDVIEFIIEKAMGSPFDYSLSPLEGSVNKIGTGATSIVKGIKNEEGDQEAANDQIFKGIDQIAYGINNIAVGLPYRPSKKIIKQVGEVVNPEGAKSTEVEKLGKKILFEQYKFNHELNKVSDEDRKKMLSDTTMTGIMNDISVVKSEITQRKADLRDAKNLNNSMEEDTRRQILNEYPQIIDSLYRDVVEKYKDFDFPKSYKPKK